MKKKIINPKRFKTVIFFLIIAALCLVLSLALHADREYQTKTVYVNTGESIWEIAQLNNNTDMPIRQYVDLVCKMNNTSGNIHPGQALKLPVE